MDNEYEVGSDESCDITDGSYRDITGMSYDDYVKICEDLNPGSTGYTSEFD